MDIDQETTALIAASKVQGTEVYNDCRRVAGLNSRSNDR